MREFKAEGNLTTETQRHSSYNFKFEICNFKFLKLCLCVSVVNLSWPKNPPRTLRRRWSSGSAS